MNIVRCVIFAVVLVVLICIAIFVLLFAFSESSSPTIRQTTNGPVEGIVLTSIMNQEYYAFKGIPYAEPPITGIDPYTDQMVDRRFKATESLKRKWIAPLKVNNTGPACIPTSFDSAFEETSEDCLSLNIYVPANGSNKKTVLVYIHGGGFNKGSMTSGNNDPEFLLSEDNIVVLLQYRLGVFGFLNLNRDEYSGNMGLKDQQVALKWIYENIENFSGNKNEILLFGQSAGGASVHFHMLNEESRKYFSRAFMMSSSAFSYYALNPAGNIDKIQNCTQIYDTKKLIEYLKKADSSELTKCYPYHQGDYNNITWVPTIEHPTAPQPFQTKLPEDIYNSNYAPTMDALFGFTNKEGILFNTTLINYTKPIIENHLWESDIQLPFRGFDKHAYPNEYLEALKILNMKYFNGSKSINDVSLQNIALMSDLVINESVLRSAVYQTEANNKHNGDTIKPNTYLFRFSIDTAFIRIKTLQNISFVGATHSDDKCYYFHCKSSIAEYEYHLKQKDKPYYDIKRMVKIITNFARTGNPSIEGDTPFIPNQSRNEMYCQEISNSNQTSVTYNITEQLHYKAWREIENIYRKCIKHSI